MERYQRVEKPKPEQPINENEIRVIAQGLIRNYITYAISLIQDKQEKEVMLKAMWQAISKAVSVGEIIKIGDETTSLSNYYCFIDHRAEQKLSRGPAVKLENDENKKEQQSTHVISSTDVGEDYVGGQRQSRGRGRGKGRGRDRGKGGYGYYRENGGYYNRGGAGGRGRGWGYRGLGEYERGRGGGRGRVPVYGYGKGTGGGNGA